MNLGEECMGMSYTLLLKLFCKFKMVSKFFKNKELADYIREKFTNTLNGSWYVR